MENTRPWSASETRVLICLWSKATIQAKLESSYRNKTIYEGLAGEMHQHGYERTWLQCQRKIKHLKTSYKRAKDANNRSGNGRTTCPFFDELDSVLCDRPTTQPLVSFDSAAPENEEGDEDESTGEGSAAEPLDCRTNEDTPETGTTDSSTEASHQTVPSGRGARLGGKRKRTRMEASFDALTKAMTTQFEQEAKLQLQMQATQHEHELRLFNIFVNAFSTGQQSSHANLAPQHNSTPFYRVPDFQPPTVSQFPFPQSHFVPLHLQRLSSTPRQLNDSDELSSLGESSTHYNL
ncbi:hypothetical protein R3I93_006661 [Phoxinus phoxinus]|uniref:Myb/SANT-like DNA-binding domain-containing protein n=1 Tax=Phoxinus phoxinus TaxID=58324 RepID=A0AAN9D6U1_9TELE